MGDLVERLLARRATWEELSVAATEAAAAITQRDAVIKELVEALERVERWNGEFPETGEFWDKEKTRPISYGAQWGSNGERDFMRNIARTAIARAKEMVG